MTEALPRSPDAVTLEKAAAWYVDLRGTAADDPLRQAHARWLALDPTHRKAWERVERLRQVFDRLPEPVDRDTLQRARASRRQMLGKLGVLLATGASVSLAWHEREGIRALAASHRSGTGERREIMLADGGRVHMNTATALDVNYDAARRALRLYTGEILVTTARDRLARPFVVLTRHGNLRALGTRFLVRSDTESTLVQVLEHAVEIHPADGGDVLRVEAGQQVRFTVAGGDDPRALETRPDAWTSGLLVVDNWRLERLVDELARYHRGYLGCDPAVAGLMLSGAFQLDDIPGILENLSATLPVRVRQITRYWARLESR